MHVRMVLGHVMAHRESRRILYFLGVNVIFMLVELGVGLANNSLGLISDAGKSKSKRKSRSIGHVDHMIAQ